MQHKIIDFMFLMGFTACGAALWGAGYRAVRMGDMVTGCAGVLMGLAGTILMLPALQKVSGRYNARVVMASLVLTMAVLLMALVLVVLS